MADRGIIFSAPMVRALLDGRKTQTRRVLKPQPPEGATMFVSGLGKRIWDWPGLGLGSDDGRELPRPPFAPGDRLWVREAIYADRMGNFLTGERTTNAVVAYYAADDEDVTDHAGFNLAWLWQRPTLSGRFMPRAYSRLTLVVTEVRVQRLHEISFADCLAEGCDPAYREEVPDCPEPFCGGLHHGEKWHYQHLWDSIHGPGAWALNPWVAAVSFTVHRCSIDSMGAM